MDPVTTSKMRTLKEQLECMGFRPQFGPDSIPLLEDLLSELFKTTDELKQYMALSEKCLQDLRDLEGFTEAYKMDNAKLVNEVNKLHKEILSGRHGRIEYDAKGKCSFADKAQVEHVSTFDESYFLNCTQREHEAKCNAVKMEEKVRRLQVELDKVLDERKREEEEREKRALEHTKKELEVWKMKCAKLEEHRDKILGAPARIEQLERELEACRGEKAKIGEELAKIKKSYEEHLANKHAADNVVARKLKTENKSLKERLAIFEAKELHYTAEIDRLCRVDEMRKRHLAELEERLSKPAKAPVVGMQVTKKPLTGKVLPKKATTTVTTASSVGKNTVQALEKLRSKYAEEERNLREDDRRGDGRKREGISQLEGILKEVESLKLAVKEKEDLISKLNGENEDLKNKLKNANDSDDARYRAEISALESRINDLEKERNLLSEALNSHSCAEMCHHRHHHHHRLWENHYRNGDSEMDRSRHRLELDLAEARDRVRTLELERTSTQEEMMRLRDECAAGQARLTDVIGCKDQLEASLDDKTERMHALERQLKSRVERIADMEKTMENLRKKLDLTTGNNAKSDELMRKSTRETAAMRARVQLLEKSKEEMFEENKKLRAELSALTRDWQISNENLTRAKIKEKELDAQLRAYIDTVRAAEEMLRSKEVERGKLLDDLRTLSLDATKLESQNSSLEEVVTTNKSALQAAEMRIEDLENILARRDASISSYENQVKEAKATIEELEMRVGNLNAQRGKLESDLHICSELRDRIDAERDALCKAVPSLSKSKSELEEECIRLKEESKCLKSLLSKEQINASILERIVEDERRNSMQHMLAAKEYADEIRSLRAIVERLEKSLSDKTKELRDNFTEMDDLRKEIVSLKRKMTNVEFERVKSSSESYGSCVS